MCGGVYGTSVRYRSMQIYGIVEVKISSIKIINCRRAFPHFSNVYIDSEKDENGCANCIRNIPKEFCIRNSSCSHLSYIHQDISQKTFMYGFYKLRYINTLR